MTMTADQPEQVIDPSTSQLPEQLPAVRSNGAALSHVQPPTVESMIVTALERGADVSVIERMVALAERLKAQQAEQAFNEAMLSFRIVCPPILRTSEARDPEKGNRLLYRFADLSEVTKVVDPHLFANGLSYTFDSEANGDETVVTCWVHHVAGARRSARFQAKGTGTRIMSPAQVEASVVTFGKRQSLVMALGIQTDLDDDGRRAAPRDQPDADPTQPTVPTRAERAAQPPLNGVTAKDLNDLLAKWRQRSNQPKGTVADFQTWAAGVVNWGPADAALLASPKNWSREQVELCEEAML